MQSGIKVDTESLLEKWSVRRVSGVNGLLFKPFSETSGWSDRKDITAQGLFHPFWPLKKGDERCGRATSAANETGDEGPARRLFPIFQSAHRAFWSRQRAKARCSGVGRSKRMMKGVGLPSAHALLEYKGTLQRGWSSKSAEPSPPT